MTTEYDDYLRTEWASFVADPSRARSTRAMLSIATNSRLLDLGCGAGQELLPFAKDAFCVGVDFSPRVGRVGRELFAQANLEGRVNFARAAAEHLPFQANAFDAVICRLALPYTDNSRTLKEIARVLKPNGSLLLKIHHARYYMRKFWTGLMTGQVLSMIHATRVLLAGFVYHLTGRQVRIRLLSPETFQTEWLLRRELTRYGMAIQTHLADSNPLTPAFFIRKMGMRPA